MGARYVIPFGVPNPLPGDAIADRYKTIVMVEIQAYATRFALTGFTLRAHYDDDEDHNAAIEIWRGVGGTAHSQKRAETIPKIDPGSSDPRFRMRYGFLTEPMSEPRDRLIVWPIPSAKIIGPIKRRERDGWVFTGGQGLRILVASREDLRAKFTGELEVIAR
jgi:hypothetical protein